MRYIYTGGQVVPKQCKFGPRPAEGLVLNPLEWWSITDHLVRDQREAELVEIQKAKERKKRDISFEMTKNWSNTLASVKTQSEQKRIEKKEKEKQDKIDEYNEILKNRKEEKKQILENIKKVLKENRDSLKTIKSGLLLSMILKERQQQIAMKNKLKEEEKFKDLELGKKFKAEAEEFEKEKLEEKQKNRRKKRELKEGLDKQVKELKQKAKAEKDELAREKQDLINMQIESDKIRQCNLVEKNYRQEFASKYLRKDQNQIDHEQKLKLEQEEEDEINKIYVEYAKKLEKGRKEKESLLLKTIIEERMRISEKLMAQKSQNLYEMENKRYEEIEKEKMALAAEASQIKLQQRNAAISDILERKKKADEAEAKRRYEEKEITKWEVIQACRSEEINNAWWRDLKERQKKQKEEMRMAYDEQCKSKKEAKLAKAECLISEEDSVLDDEKEILDLVIKHDLPEYPVLAAISKLKKNKIIKVKDNENKEESSEKNQKSERTKKPELPGSAWYCFKY